MKKISDLGKYRNGSHKVALQAFYATLDSLNGLEADPEIRQSFFRKKRGEFISIFRRKSGWEINEAARFLGKTDGEMIAIEDGHLPLTDRDFFKLCHFIGAVNEVNVFIEKLEEAAQAGLRKARGEMAATVKSYGINFASSHQKDLEEPGKILQFQRR